jgi:hypothetical protein
LSRFCSGGATGNSSKPQLKHEKEKIMSVKKMFAVLKQLSVAVWKFSSRWVNYVKIGGGGQSM